MVDKIWFDWQNAHPENFWSFAGGSVTAHSQPGLYKQFPIGGPPFLNVSEGFFLAALALALSLIHAPCLVWKLAANGWNPQKRHCLPGHEHQEQKVVLRL